MIHLTAKLKTREFSEIPESQFTSIVVPKQVLLMPSR